MNSVFTFCTQISNPHQHPEISASTRMWLMGSVAGLIHDIKPAQQIVDSMVAEAAALLDRGQKMTQVQAKL